MSINKLNIRTSNSLIATTILLTIILAGACGLKHTEKKAEEKKTTQNKFSGRWIAERFSSPLSLTNIQANAYGFTEIDIPDDTVTYVRVWNEDVDMDSIKAFIHSDTLITLWKEKEIGRYVIIGNKLTNLPDDANEKPLTFTLANTTLVKTADSLKVTCVRILLNRWIATAFHKQTREITSLRFMEDGKITGLHPFTQYYISIGGDEANIQDGVAVALFESKDRQLHLGIKNGRKTTEIPQLYTLKLLTGKSEKPEYKTDKVWRH